MKYLLLVSHATFAEGMRSSLEMLLGPRENLLSCGMDAAMAPAEYVAQLEEALAVVTPQDEIAVLADIAGGSPVRCAMDVLERKGLAERMIGVGGANLPMAISALMGLEEGFDLTTLRDALLADGTQAVREL